ncbi:NAD(P)H-hydrate dehydratase [archaeon]|jgi:ADP-dependent NAD(P)H-hydrate dehydratase / NAD(P)H-hydrate epimerase|nr:NAD(P)H-hydrate dehydratase [archaeon]MBT4023089.1 NAD(P)H-hydrate dehydratase [archaeon]MBT4272487.1 NAD(P)H-hydrate dehydratase [archaeon]MBT4460585.1 NAD(P)H-hydrate dehydratase [archaeon]MBT4857825.1 NAD(P)H-hydrate dehydratase [archaeon]
MRIKRKEYKGQNGKVLIIGGSKEYTGAPYLSAMAAMRTGIDLVTICAPEKTAWAINHYSPDMITRKLLGDDLNLTHTKEIILLSEEFDVILIGPGLGLKKDFVLKILREIQKPFVIDADALKVLNLESINNAILTPHIKEFQTLYNNTIQKPQYDELELEMNIRQIKQKIGNNIILLKGKEDTIFSKHRRYVNKTGHNSMTKGGTGDILSGICAGYLAQTKNLFDSAKEAAYTNGKLGEYMYKQKGYGYTANEMVNELWRFTK